MGKFKELAIQADGAAMTDTIWIKIIEILDDHLSDLEMEDPTVYHEIISDIYVALNGPYFDESTLLKATAKLQNEDGTVGPKWSVAETTSVASSLGIVFDKFNVYDWNYAMNTIYSDFSTVVGSATTTYFALAKAWIMDKDAPEGKAYLYYKMLCGV